jgi:hypothetical protein
LLVARSDLGVAPAVWQSRLAYVPLS